MENGPSVLNLRGRVVQRLAPVHEVEVRVVDVVLRHVLQGCRELRS